MDTGLTAKTAKNTEKRQKAEQPRYSAGLFIEIFGLRGVGNRSEAPDFSIVFAKGAGTSAGKLEMGQIRPMGPIPGRQYGLRSVVDKNKQSFFSEKGLKRVETP